MSKNNNSGQDERIRQALEEHARRNQRSLPSGRPIRSGTIALLCLLVTASIFYATGKGQLYLNRLLDNVFVAKESAAALEPEQLVDTGAGVASSENIPRVSDEKAPGNSDPLSADEDVHLIRDRLLALVHRDSDDEVVAAVKTEARALVRRLPVSDDRKSRLYRVIDEAALPGRNRTNRKGGLLRVSGEDSFNGVSDNTLMVVDGRVGINSISDSLVIIDGELSINSSKNNIIISSGDVRINAERGGLVMTNGMMQITYAEHTIFSAENGVNITARKDAINFGPGLFGTLKYMLKTLFQ